MRRTAHTRAKAHNVMKSLLVASAVLVSPLIMSAQEGEQRYRDRGTFTRLEPGTSISVRTNETIDVEQSDHRVYTGIVDRDVWGDNRRLAIPRGSRVELMVRVARDNDLILDLDSVMVNGDRYAVRADPNRIESAPDRSIVGSILESAGVEVRGRAVRVPRDSVVTFRLERPLEMGVLDRGFDRDGWHYHDSPR